MVANKLRQLSQLSQDLHVRVRTQLIAAVTVDQADFRAKIWTAVSLQRVSSQKQSVDVGLTLFR